MSPRTSISRPATYGLTMALVFSSLSPLAAQSRWDTGLDRNRDTYSQSRSGLWQGSGWLGGPTAENREWHLGVRGDNSEVGVRVREVSPGSAAARARIEPGDIIISVAGYQVGLVDGRLYDLAEEINRRADPQGVTTLLVQDHRNYGLASVRVQLDDSRQALKGRLVIRPSRPLPSDALVSVQIENVTRPYYQVRHGQSTFRPNASGDIPFEIAYDPTYIYPEDSYQVRAVITSGGRTIYDTPQPQRVITRGNPSQVQLQLVSVRGGGTITAGYPNYNEIDNRLILMFRQYLRREPTALELAVLRTTPGIAERIDSIPLELMAAQEYFDAAGNNNTVWLEKVFEEIVRKRPSQRELQQWMQRFAELRYSRTELLRQLYAQAPK